MINKFIDSRAVGTFTADLCLSSSFAKGKNETTLYFKANKPKAVNSETLGQQVAVNKISDDTQLSLR